MSEHRTRLPPLKTNKAQQWARTPQPGEASKLTGTHRSNKATGRSAVDSSARAFATPALTGHTAAMLSFRSETGGLDAASSVGRPPRAPMAFKGLARKTADSDLAPAASPLPDMSNWRNPELRQQSVRSRMANIDGLADRSRFESPFKSERLHQPPPLRCVPIPFEHGAGGGPANQRESTMDKPAVLEAMVKSTPGAAGRLKRGMSVIELASILRASMRYNKSFSVPKEDYTMADLESADYARDQLDVFEDDVDDKIALGDFASQRKTKKVPIMVLKQFRHQLCDESALVKQLRAMPLRRIEEAIEEVGMRTLNAGHWGAFIAKLVGPAYSRLESHALFSFFDTDADGDVDQREICNGFVLILSDDGPLVSVLQRCKTFLQGNIKDTRLTFMTRFELVLMFQAILVAARGKLKDAQMAVLERDLNAVLTTEGTNRRGQFPFDDVRNAVLRSAAIKHALGSFTVPREPRLFKSPISHYFRNAECDEGEQPFKLMNNVKALDRRARRQSTAGSLGMDMGDLDFDVSPGCAASTDTRPPDLAGPKSPATAAADRRKSLLLPLAAGPTGGGGSRRASVLSVASGGAVEVEEPPPERDVYEPGEPQYYTLRGTLFRKLDGEPPEIYWVPGMPSHIKYSEPRP